MGRPTYHVDFARTDDLGHVMVRTVSSGDLVTMVDEDGTSCVGTVVLHSPDLGLLLVRPDPETRRTSTVVVDGEAMPRPRTAAGEPEALRFPLTGARRV